MRLGITGWIFIASSFSIAAAKPTLGSQIPLSISTVASYRVDEKLVRIIEYNTALVPRLEIELIKVPGRVLLAKLVVDRIRVNHEGKNLLLDFEQSAGVGIDSVMVDKNKKQIRFNVEYFLLEDIPVVTFLARATLP